MTVKVLVYFIIFISTGIEIVSTKVKINRFPEKEPITTFRSGFGSRAASVEFWIGSTSVVFRIRISGFLNPPTVDFRIHIIGFRISGFPNPHHYDAVWKKTPILKQAF